MTTIVIDPGNYLRIDAVWAAISVDDDGNEGLCAVYSDGMWVPLLACDEARLQSIIDKARQLARESGKPVRIIRLDRRTEVSTIDPRN